MSIQSTIMLTRKDAEQRLVSKLINKELEKQQEQIERLISFQVASMSNDEIEMALEETFDNFMILSTPQKEKD